MCERTQGANGRGITSCLRPSPSRAPIQPCRMGVRCADGQGGTRIPAALAIKFKLQRGRALAGAELVQSSNRDFEQRHTSTGPRFSRFSASLIEEANVAGRNVQQIYSQPFKCRQHLLDHWPAPLKLLPFFFLPCRPDVFWKLGPLVVSRYAEAKSRTNGRLTMVISSASSSSSKRNQFRHIKSQHRGHCRHWQGADTPAFPASRVPRCGEL